MKQVIVAFAAIFFASNLLATTKLVEYPSVEFNPSLEEQFEIQIDVSVPGQLSLRIETEDGDVVRQLVSKKAVDAGIMSIKWDGKDDAGTVVPDEAYVPVTVLTVDGKEQLNDPRKVSGGEIIEDLHVHVDSPIQVSFQLPAPARVMARAGIKAGPMMRALSDWAPRPAGANKILWDSKDQSGIDEFGIRPDAAVMLVAYKLPKGAIITTGNSKIQYGDYRRLKGWSFSRPERRVLMKKRGEFSLSPSFFEPKYFPVTPRISMTISDVDVKLTPSGKFILDKPVLIKVDIEDSDRWALESSLFEVGFYIDYRFHTEEEQGYVPFVWRLDPAGMSSGHHILTVNVSGYDGQVGVASLLFEVP